MYRYVSKNNFIVSCLFLVGNIVTKESQFHLVCKKCARFKFGCTKNSFVILPGYNVHEILYFLAIVPTRNRKKVLTCLRVLLTLHVQSLQFLRYLFRCLFH